MPCGGSFSVLRHGKSVLRDAEGLTFPHANTSGMSFFRNTPFADRLYLLNTDPDNDASVKLWFKGKETPSFIVPANETCIVYILGNIVVIPETHHVDLKEWTLEGTTNEFIFFRLENQKASVLNLGTRAKVKISGKEISLDPGKTATIKIERLVNPERKEFYSKDFWEEPRIKNGDTRTPY